MAVQASGLDLDCHDCPEGLKRFRGCTEEVDTPFEFEGDILRRCPLQLITQTTKKFMRFYQFMEKGFLPNPGGLLEQPNRFLEAMSVLNDTISRSREEQRKENEDRQKHLGSGKKWQ